MKIAEHASNRMAQPAGHAMAVDGRTDRFGDNQPDPRTGFVIVSPSHVDDEIGLRDAHPVLHCRVEFP